MTTEDTTRRAYLHIGLPKTGTTYLQSILWKHKASLAEAGLLLPGRNHRHHLLASLDVRGVANLADRPGRTDHPWRDLLDDTLPWKHDVLVTHEFFASASPDQIVRMVTDLEGFEVHVVVTARSVADLFPSRWQEWVKNGGRKPIDDYPPRSAYAPTDNWGWGSFDLADVLQRWSSVIDPSQIHVIAVDTTESPDALWARFAAVVGVSSTGVEPFEESANPGLGLVELELLRRINPQLHNFRSSTDRGNWIRGRLAEGGWMPQRKESFRVGPELRGELLARTARALELLAKGGFDLIGSSRALEAKDDSSLRHPAEVSDTEMLDSSTELVAAMLDHIRNLTRENRELSNAATRARATVEESETRVANLEARANRTPFPRLRKR